jgi:hypothetical protein
MEIPPTKMYLYIGIDPYPYDQIPNFFLVKEIIFGFVSMSLVIFSGARYHGFMVNREDFLSAQAGHQEPPTAPTPAVSSGAAIAWSGDLGMW